MNVNVCVEEILEASRKVDRGLISISEYNSIKNDIMCSYRASREPVSLFQKIKKQTVVFVTSKLNTLRTRKHFFFATART